MEFLLLISIFLTITSAVHSQTPLFINVTLLQDAVASGAVCLDGSPPGYHFASGVGDGAMNWLVYLQGGGWCGSVEKCLGRVQNDSGRLGSSRSWTVEQFDGIFSQNCSNNPDFCNWNRVLVRYCDGSSFTGDVEAVDPANNLHLRGARIFRFVVEDLLARGMNNSMNVMLAGSSSGGQATMINCDRFRGLVPNASRLKCISDAGFFIIARNIPGAARREKTFADVNVFHNMSKLLPPSCTSKMDASLCLFPENFAGSIETPLFILNSDFDSVQLDNMLNPYDDAERAAGWKSCLKDYHNCTPDNLQILKDFRSTMLKDLQDVDDNPSRGVFINSCYLHPMLLTNTTWIGNGEKLANKTVAKAVGDWYFDRGSVKEIDTTNTDLPLQC